MREYVSTSDNKETGYSQVKACKVHREGEIEIEKEHQTNKEENGSKTKMMIEKMKHRLLPIPLGLLLGSIVIINGEVAKREGHLGKSERLSHQHF